MNMENKSLQEVQKELEEVVSARKKEEAFLSEVQAQLSALQKSTEGSLEKLSALKDQETSLQYKVFLMQKDAIKDAISVNGLMKVFSDKNPLVKALKDKGKEIKEVFDGTAFDKQWVDEQYEKYKDACIKKGEEFKSKEEFKSVALTIKDLKTEGNAQITAIASKAGNGLKKFSKALQETIRSNVAVSSEVSVSSEDESDKLDVPTTKGEGLDLWLKHSGETYNEEKLADLYEAYVAYLNKEFDGKIAEDAIYSFKGGSFKKALKKAFQL